MLQNFTRLARHLSRYFALTRKDIDKEKSRKIKRKKEKDKQRERIRWGKNTGNVNFKEYTLQLDYDRHIQH